MKATVYEVYVNDTIQEMWETPEDAFTRGKVIEGEFGEGSVRIIQNTFYEVINWRAL